MTYYQEKLRQLHKKIYANQGQIDTVIAMRKYIDCHFQNDLHLDQLSDVQFTSKFHLLRLFKRYYGLTPRQYLINKRIEQSKKYLIKGHSVTETCFAVGFRSLGSFSALFKNKTGKSPIQFRKEQFSRRISERET